MTTNKQITMEHLKTESIHVTDGTVIMFPQYQKTETLCISNLIPKFPGCFATNNSTVSFITTDGHFFVTPYTTKKIHLLKELGFSKENFYVPFSNWDYPIIEQSLWELLQKDAKKEWENEFHQDCKNFCRKNNINELSQEIMDNCFVIPNSGLKIKHLYFEDCFFPILTSGVVDSYAIDKLGKFAKNNGVVVFVGDDGKTYLSRSYKIIQVLLSKGYKEARLFVPLSNGEEIIDPILSKKWDTIKKN